MPQTLVSIVVPVWRDGEALGQLLARLAPEGVGDAEVIVVGVAGEGDVQDRIGASARGVRYLWAAERGRGIQMNEGARVARGTWLWFVHADSRPPERWSEIFRGLGRHADPVWGHFRFALDSPRLEARRIERMVAWRVRRLALPYGDQGIFVRRDVFEEIGGYRPWPLMEDVDLVRRLRRIAPAQQVDAPLITSARRWEREGWTRRSARNLALLGLYFAGVAPDRLARWYDRSAAR